jgi:hypothetical protein
MKYEIRCKGEPIEAIEVLFDSNNIADRTFTVYFLQRHRYFIDAEIKEGKQDDSYIIALKAVVDYLDAHPELFI